MKSVYAAAVLAAYSLSAAPTWAQETKDWDGGAADVNDNNYSNGENWDPTGTPASIDQAAFGQFATPKNNVSIDVTASIDRVLFRGGANAQSFNLNITSGNTYSILGTSTFGGTTAGVENSSGLTQTFSFGNANSVLSIGGDSTFVNSGTGSATVINNIGQVNFLGTSDAGDSDTTINNTGTGITSFVSGTSAGSANINNTDTGATVFTGGSARAGNATIMNGSGLVGDLGGSTTFNTGSDAETARITNNANGQTIFNDSSSATQARITNSGTTDNLGETIFNDNGVADRSAITNNANGQTSFNDTSRSNTADITNNDGGVTNFNDAANTTLDSESATQITNNDGGTTNFNDTSQADNSTITNNDGGTTNFNDTPDAANLTIINNEGGTVDITGTTTGVSIGTLSGAGSINLGNKALTLGNLNRDDEISGTITEDTVNPGSSLTKIGTGNLTLSGNANVDQVNVNAGTLTVNSVSSDGIGGGRLSTNLVNVNAGATLRGVSDSFNGISGSILVNNGTLDAGNQDNPFGSLSAGGDVIINGNDSVFVSRISGGSSNAVYALGSVTLDGQVRANIDPDGTYTVNNQRLLAQGFFFGRNGEFDGVDLANSNIPSYLTLSPGNGVNGADGLFYNPAEAYLVFRRNSLGGVDQGDSDNQRALFRALNGSDFDNLSVDQEEFINSFILSGGNNRDRLTGDALTAFPVISQGASNRFNQQLLMQALQQSRADQQLASVFRAPRLAYTGTKYREMLAQAPAMVSPVANGYGSTQSGFVRRSNVWATIGRAKENGDSDDNGPGFDARSTDYQIGVTRNVNENTVVGISVGKSESDVNINDRNADGDIDSTSLGLFARHDSEKFYVSGLLSYSRHDINAERETGIGTARADYDGRTLAAWGEVGKKMQSGGYSIEPNVSLKLSSTRQDGFEEDGPGALDVDSNKFNSRRLGLGVRITRNDADAKVRPHLFLGYEREFGDEKAELTNQLSGLSAFTVESTDLGKNIFAARLGADARISDRFSLVGEVGASFRKNQDSQYIFGGVKYGF